MKLTLFGAATALFLVAGLIFAGCSDNNSSASNNSGGTVAVVSVYPADGSTDVPATASVAIKFTGPVDTLSVMHNMFLAGGQPMHQWIDSLDDCGGFGMMSMGMADHMMHWMDSIRTPGEFHWNAALDSCRFVPDAGLADGTDYLCLYYEGGMFGRHGGMMGGQNHNDSGYHMFEFTTAP
jgi:hypothetical protein